MSITRQKVDTGYMTGDRRFRMDALAALIAIVAAIVGFDLAAVRFGADSRESIGDDHAR